MRAIFQRTGILCLLFLSACGNANDGRRVSLGRTSSPVNDNVAFAQNIAVTRLAFCRDPLFVSADANFNTLFAGSVACPTEGAAANGRGNAVRLKVNNNFPANARLCMVPFVGDSAVTETCFMINGQLDVPLTTNLYTSVVVLAESNLALYKSFLASSAIVPPPRVVYSL